MTAKARTLTVLSLAATLIGARAQSVATNAITATPLTLSPTEQEIQDIKNPFPWLSWGGDFRVRNEYFNNALSLTGVSAPNEPGASPLFGYLHAQDYFRFRGRVWMAITPVDDVTFNVRLAAEPREFMEPSTMDTYYDREGMQWRYGIIDNLNVQWRKAFGLPVTVTVGRQDIFLGDGWLVGDGTPEDGSFTTFLDSARITVNLAEQKTTIDAIGIIQDGRPDGWLPTIGPSTSQGGNPEPYLLTDQNEKGAIVWVANKSIPQANLDGFFLYKNDTRITSDPAATFGDNADIFTFGGSVSGLVEDHWKYMAEGAYQFGRKQDPELNGQTPAPNPLLAPSAQTKDYRDLSAFGVNARLSYLFNDKWNDQVHLCFEFLSGDDPNTGTDEMFDTLWGRWPRWSEMYNIYSYVQETRVGQTANLWRIGPMWTVSPSPKFDFSAAYYALFADQSVPTRDLNETLNPALGLPAIAGPFSTTGNFRGHYFQTIFKYKFNKHLSGHLWGEWLLPGDYYVSKGLIQFLRVELMLTF
ncbi:MAG TPA: alginate export family protein [Candidatus Acidoferrum sp.]|nr:alginate export family protein [Candidatus Acidoferrum sp.]